LWFFYHAVASSAPAFAYSCTGGAKPIPTVLSRHHHHQGASFIGVVVVDDALVALICRNVVVLREKL
jgi:hypothetical protein